MTRPTASAIAADVRSGETTARQVVDAALARAEADTHNCFTALDADGATARAANIDRAVAEGRDPGPLAGVPIALKDLIDQEGLVTTCGSDFYRHTAARSATVVERLEAAGAVVVGRTGLHEFAYGFSSENQWYGPVRNPWDPTLSPGGSSGGSGAAVGAGITPIAIGTDTGGSVRVPAALCGTVGLKVTHGRVSTRGVFPLAESLDTVGPLATTVADTRLAYEMMAGGDPDDPWSIDHLPDDQRAADRVHGLRVGIPLRWLADAPASAETRQVFATTLDRLSDAGATIVELDDHQLGPDPLGWTLSAAEAASVHREWIADPDKVYGDEVRARLDAATEVTVDEFITARRWQAALLGSFRRAFHRVDVIATPATGHPRKTIGVHDIDVPGGPQPYRMVLAAFSATVNQSWCPAIALPLPDTGRPPHALQLIGPWWHEDRLLTLGEDLELIGLVGTSQPA